MTQNNCSSCNVPYWSLEDEEGLCRNCVEKNHAEHVEERMAAGNDPLNNFSDRFPEGVSLSNLMVWAMPCGIVIPTDHKGNLCDIPDMETVIMRADCVARGVLFVKYSQGYSYDAPGKEQFSEEWNLWTVYQGVSYGVCSLTRYTEAEWKEGNEPTSIEPHKEASAADR